MSLRSQPTPTRVPPPPMERRPANPPPSVPRTLPLPPPVPGTVANDAYLLQEQIEQLAGQFEELKAQLRQAQKLASIGTTAAMLAHEFNNLFAPVVAYARHALDTDDVDMMRKALTKTLQGTDTVREMADRLVGLARQDSSVIQTVHVLKIAQNAIGCLMRDPQKDNITVNLQIDPELAVRANENQLLQVMFNLVINARQAMLGRAGRLTIDAAPTHEGRVMINVRDTGCGISPENLPRIFEPFFTTKKNADKPDKRGLGLGLSICRDLIEELGGDIDVESRPGSGTTFTITLPQAD